jgi:DNA-binding SARP family transcriptional activator
MPAIQLSLARQPQVLLDGRAQPLPALDAALLSWLALQGPTARARLAEMLWSGSGEQARGTLRQRLYKLRQGVGAELVVGQQTLALAPLVQHDLADALTLLDGVTLDPGTEMAQWLSQERERRRMLRRQQWAQALQQAESASDADAGLQTALQWLQADPEHEAAHASVIRQHYLLGDRAAALAAYQRCEQMLQRTSGAQPQPQTQALLRWLQTPGAPAAPAAGGVPAVLLRPPRLVGRGAELAAAHAAWAQGKLLALVADAGMGKTRLLQQLAVGAEGSTVYAAARPGDAGVPLATLARLLRRLHAAPRVLASVHQHELARVLPEWRHAVPSGTALGEPLQLQRALRALLAAQPGLQRVLLDDLHFADGASLQLLQALLCEAAGPPQDESTPVLQWALGYRPAEASGPLHDLHDALLESARLHAVALAPLSPAALQELLDDLALPGLAGPKLAQALWQRTGGNPMFVLEALKQGLGEGGASAAALAKPLSVQHLIERRLAQLSPTALALARCAAIAGSDFSTALAAAVLQTPAIALADAWGQLEAAGVLREQAFAHDLVFEAALASVPKPIARHLHAEVAAHLQTTGGAAPATLARHWLAAGQPKAATGYLRQAAVAAAQAYDVAEAARLWTQLTQLHESAGDIDTAFETGLQAVDALRIHTSGGVVDAAIERLHPLARTPAQKAEVWSQRANLCLLRGETPAALSAAEQGLQVLGPDAPAASRLSLLNTLGILKRHGGQLDSAATHLREAVALARALDPPAADLAAYLNNLALVLQEQDEHLDAIALMQEAAERQTDPSTRARVLNNMAISLDEIGQAPLALERRLAAARVVAGSGNMVELMLAISLGANTRALCRYQEALEHLARAQTLGHHIRHNRQEDLARQQAMLWLQLGRVNLAREVLQDLQSSHPRDFGKPVVALVRARLALALRQPDEAAALLQDAAVLMQTQGHARALRRLWLTQATLLPADESLALMQQALGATEVQRNAAAALPLTVRLAQAQLRLAQPAAALQAAQRAADWLGAVWPMEMTPAEVWLTLAQAAQALDQQPLAHHAATRGMAFVDQVAEQHLQEMYRDGWRRLNPVNAELAAVAAQLRV